MKTEKEKFDEAILVLDRHIFQFFESHKAIDKTKFEREFSLPFRSLRDFLNGKIDFPKVHREKLLSGMEYYGWDRLERWENDPENIDED